MALLRLRKRKERHDISMDSMKEFRFRGIVIRYPAGTFIVNPELNTREPGRAGSFLAVDFNPGAYSGTNCFFQEMLFHSLQSCTDFIENLKPEEMEGDFSPEAWYHAREFKEHKQIFDEVVSDPEFQIVRTASGRKFLKGNFNNTYVFFQDSIRVMVYVEGCDSNLFEQLLGHIIVEQTNK
jgi:hypothetical protein